ncbi:MAG: tRNA (adenosine(37)-N6)-threonylcarbamoyltransferase complex ATPase subunit type 1 TsaE [Bacteroidales bacterium]|jgi:tRNA threonylcarbamoyladenosine biosynthesis protein TsaE|nr:tRNA (adenosine(37)-N6)-threonylcarbamoyltransferase complex ATPase subunit type 1 TsaE [Bacteroidales bacterium]MDD4361877.1 tRNA (adenosine(37)-N6)-threonylcarbamoyltransferase complex ATPase subunit type 1 TsaE [Bacteroidales bacterium]MDD4430486.1 tRNA (adenosine(37)-N6)-threonylcarbamoyltransferase complex ATPase subunit type 1 TsaE [Bacteroidales bacterium]
MLPIDFQLSGIQQAARLLLNNFPGQKLFAFYGGMGAGKTTLIQAICRELGVKSFVNSPSFALINEYPLNKGDAVYHFDFYRINKLQEAYSIGSEEYFYSDNYCFIEWPEKIEELLPEDCIRIDLKVLDTGERRISQRVGSKT